MDAQYPKFLDAKSCQGSNSSGMNDINDKSKTNYPRGYHKNKRWHLTFHLSNEYDRTAGGSCVIPSFFQKRRWVIPSFYQKRCVRLVLPTSLRIPDLASTCFLLQTPNMYSKTKRSCWPCCCCYNRSNSIKVMPTKVRPSRCRRRLQLSNGNASCTRSLYYCQQNRIDPSLLFYGQDTPFR